MTSGAQDYYMSSPFKLPGVVLGCAESGSRMVAVLSKDVDKLFVGVWDGSAEPRIIETPMGQVQHAEIYWIADKLHLFTVSMNSAGNIRTLNVQMLDGNSFSAPKLMGEQHKESAMEPGDFQIVSNKQHDKIAIISERPHMNGEKESAKVTVYEDNFKELWTATFSYDLDSKRKRYNIPMLDSLGNLFILKKFSIPNDQQFHLYALSKGRMKPAHVRINLSGQKIAQVGLGISPTGQPEIAGFTYTSQINFYEGYFFMRYDENLNVRVSSSDRFKDETCKLVSYKQTIKKIGFEDFSLVQLQSYKDKVVIALELNRAEQRKNQKAGGTDTWQVMGPTVILVLDERGNLFWTKGLQKDNAMHEQFVHYSMMQVDVIGDDAFFIGYNIADKQGNPSQLAHEFWQPNPVDSKTAYPPLSIPQGYVLRGNEQLERSILLHNPIKGECIFVAF